jgi:hypothetical protein
VSLKPNTASELPISFPRMNISPLYRHQRIELPGGAVFFSSCTITGAETLQPEMF